MASFGTGCAFSLPASRIVAARKTDSVTKTDLTKDITRKIDPEWVPFQPYLQKLIETVQLEWERALAESRISPPSGTSVTVVFQMTMDGKISKIISVEGSSNERGKKGCVAAITSRAPYSRWTPEMVTALGQSRELTFTFFYE
jgi:hypothetical protein